MLVSSEPPSNSAVIVVGAGPAGIGAACAAARAGAAVLLVEQAGYPGGVATNCCCPYLMGYGLGGRQVCGGVADELVRELDRLGQARFLRHPDQVPEAEHIGGRPLVDNVVTSVEGLRVAARRLLHRHGVRCLHYATLVGATAQGRRVTEITVQGLEGPLTLSAEAFVDATGDALLVKLAGGAVREYPTEQTMTKTILVRVGGVQDFRRPVVEEAFGRLVADGQVPLGAQDRFMGFGLLNPGEVLLNFTLTVGDGLSSADMTRMDGELREQAFMTVEWFRAHIPGFAACFLVDTACRVGVRAGRGIVGVDTLTPESLADETPVAEPVGLTARGYGGHYLERFEPPWRHYQAGVRGLPRGVLVSASFDNVTAGGRALSCDGRVIDSVRLMARCLVSGQAAGVLAAQAARDHNPAADLPYSAVRMELLAQGAILE